jgi:hypothetical protein
MSGGSITYRGIITLASSRGALLCGGTTSTGCCATSWSMVRQLASKSETAKAKPICHAHERFIPAQSFALNPAQEPDKAPSQPRATLRPKDDSLTIYRQNDQISFFDPC